MNFGVRCRNCGVAAGLYSQPSFVSGTELGIVDERTIRGQRGAVPGVLIAPVVLARLTAFATGSGGDDDLDTRLKREGDGGVVGTEVDAAGIKVAVPRVQVALPGRLPGCSLRQRRFRYAQR